jgi:hypothetical protein
MKIYKILKLFIIVKWTNKVIWLRNIYALRISDFVNSFLFSPSGSYGHYRFEEGNYGENWFDTTRHLCTTSHIWTCVCTSTKKRGTRYVSHQNLQHYDNYKVYTKGKPFVLKFLYFLILSRVKVIKSPYRNGLCDWTIEDSCLLCSPFPNCILWGAVV